MAGYSGTPLPKKLGIKEGSRVALINAPKDFARSLGGLPDGAQIVTRVTKPLDIALLFVLTERALLRDFDKLAEDRKSTRLNSSHSQISYAVFCLKKKKPTQ